MADYCLVSAVGWSRRLVWPAPRRLAFPIHRGVRISPLDEAWDVAGMRSRSAWNAGGESFDGGAALEERAGFGVRGSAPSVRSAA